jgi:hypothetical protein
VAFSLACHVNCCALDPAARFGTVPVHKARCAIIFLIKSRSVHCNSVKVAFGATKVFSSSCFFHGTLLHTMKVFCHLTCIFTVRCAPFFEPAQAATLVPTPWPSPLGSSRLSDGHLTGALKPRLLDNFVRVHKLREVYSAEQIEAIKNGTAEPTITAEYTRQVEAQPGP